MRIRTETFTRKLLWSAVVAAMPLLHTATAKADWLGCNIREVVETTNRVYVRCHNSITLNGNQVFNGAIDKSDPERAQRFISMALAASLGGRRFSLDIPASSATNVNGCAASNCRTPVTWIMQYE